MIILADGAWALNPDASAYAGPEKGREVHRTMVNGAYEKNGDCEERIAGVFKCASAGISVNEKRTARELLRDPRAERTLALIKVV